MEDNGAQENSKSSLAEENLLHKNTTTQGMYLRVSSDLTQEFFLFQKDRSRQPLPSPQVTEKIRDKAARHRNTSSSSFLASSLRAPSSARTPWSLKRHLPFSRWQAPANAGTKYHFGWKQNKFFRRSLKSLPSAPCREANGASWT